jgi:hypothetical protein
MRTLALIGGAAPMVTPGNCNFLNTFSTGDRSKVRETSRVSGETIYSR